MAKKKETEKIDVLELKKSIKMLYKDPAAQKTVMEAREFLADFQNTMREKLGKKPEIKAAAVGCAGCVICGGCVITPGLPDAEIAAVTGVDLF